MTCRVQRSRLGVVLRLAGLLAGVSSRAERATSSLPRAVLLECAERVPVERTGWGMSRGVRLQRLGGAGGGERVVRPGVSRGRGTRRWVRQRQRESPGWSGPRGTGVTEGSEWRRVGEVRQVGTAGSETADSRRRAARALRMSQGGRCSDGRRRRV